MTDLPEPLTPAECDLRDYPWMPLDVRRLLTSETWVLGSPEEKCAAVSLWCESWQQVPSGSLPDNERMLAHLSMSGAGWKKIRDEVMKSWVRCSDGRLYHPVVAEKAREAWSAKLAQKARTEAARRAKAERSAGKPTSGSGSPVADTVTSSVTEIETENVTTLVASPVTASVTENVTGSTVQDSTRQDIREERTPSLREVPQKRKCRLPADWAPSEAGLRFAADHGADVQREFPKFRDHHTAKGSLMVDWDAAWRTWCQNARQFSRGKPEPAEGVFSRMVREERAARAFVQPDFDDGMLLQ